MKTCTDCGALKPLDAFALDPHASGGRRGACKACRNAAARARYALDPAQTLRKQLAARRADPNSHRAAVNKHRATAAGKASDARYQAANRDKRLARAKAQYAIKTGRIVRQPCRVCGAPAQGHHPDYAQPLLLDWLCPIHHRQAHLSHQPRAESSRESQS